MITTYGNANKLGIILNPRTERIDFEVNQDTKITVKGHKYEKKEY